MRLFRNFVYYHFIFPRINKRGEVGIRAGGGGLENFEKLISGGGAIIRYSRVPSNVVDEVLIPSSISYVTTEYFKKKPRIINVEVLDGVKLVALKYCLFCYD